jgi:hypothetical protein
MEQNKNKKTKDKNEKQLSDALCLLLCLPLLARIAHGKQMMKKRKKVVLPFLVSGW